MVFVSEVNKTTMQQQNRGNGDNTNVVWFSVDICLQLQRMHKNRILFCNNNLCIPTQVPSKCTLLYITTV